MSAPNDRHRKQSHGGLELEGWGWPIPEGFGIWQIGSRSVNTLTLSFIPKVGK